jgi:hypothetical protein
MFRAAFPSATDQDEKRETTWVKDNYSLTGNNGSSKDPNVVRLAGIWVDTDAALELGKDYSIRHIVDAVIQASPDPAATYRRSGKGTTATTPKGENITVSPSKTLPSPSPTAVLPTPSKRRKESSPASEAAHVDASPTPAPRRSGRMKSPPAKPPSTRSNTRKPPSKATRKEKLVTPEASDEIAVDEEADGTESIAGHDLHEEDIAEQKKLIAGLKAKRGALDEVPPNLKRGRADETALQFEFREPEEGQRIVATNRRIGPRAKSLAWGIAAFTVGLGAV